MATIVESFDLVFYASGCLCSVRCEKNTNLTTETAADVVRQVTVTSVRTVLETFRKLGFPVLRVSLESPPGVVRIAEWRA